MNSKAKWILPDREIRRNTYYEFTRQFTLNEPELQRFITLDITADLRYRLYINGVWVGDGPVRAYPEHYRYDTYPLAFTVRAGENTITVRLYHQGVGDFQSIVSMPGVIAHLCSDGETILLTDEQWLYRQATEYIANVPRMSIQQGFVECVDARLAGGEWKPVATRLQADDQHGDLTPREVPFLSRTPINFKTYTRQDVVREVGHVLCFSLHNIYYPDFTRASHLYVVANLYTVLEVLESGAIACYLEGIHGLYLDGEEVCVPHGQRRADLTLDVGKYLLSLVLNCSTNPPSVSVAFGGDASIRLSSPQGDTVTPFVTERFFLSDRDSNMPIDGQKKIDIHSPPPGTFLDEAVGKARARTMDQLRELAGTSVSGACFTSVDPSVMSLTDEVIPNVTPKVLSPSALLTDSPQCATFYPADEGSVRLILDLGTLTIGYFEMELIADGGTIIDVDFSEHILKHPFHIQRTPALKNSLRYICKSGKNHFASMKRRGMRYAIVTFREMNAPVMVRYFRALESIYPVGSAGGFHCDESRLNAIYAISNRTLQLCMEDTFTDCPTYEQVLWIGDARNESLFAFHSVGGYDLAKRSCRLGAESLERLPIVGSQVPSSWDQLLPAWSFIWAINVYETYFYSGDRAFLTDIYPALRQNLVCALALCTDQGLFSLPAWNMFDWTGTDDTHCTVTHNTLFLIGALRAGVKTARELDARDDLVMYEEGLEALRNALKGMWIEPLGGFSDALHEDGERSTLVSIHTSILAYLYDAIPEGKDELVQRNILDPPEDWVPIGSPFAMFYLLEALDRMGQVEKVIQIVRSYWGRMVDENAATFWETISADFLSGTSRIGTRSHCHAWSAAPLMMLPRIILGVNVTSPGCRTVDINPQPCGLKRASGSFPTPRGSIEVSWFIDKSNEMNLSVSVPEGVDVSSTCPVLRID